MDESCGRKIWIYCQNFHTFYECVSIFYAWLPYQIIWFTAAATNLPNQLPHGAPIHDPNKPHTDWIDWDPIKYRNLMWPDLGSAHIQCMHVYTTAEHRQKHAHTHTFKHTHLVTQTHTHTLLFNHARIPPYSHPLAHGPSLCECIVGNLPSGGGYYITASASFAQPRSPNRVTVVTAVEN